jgi:transcriptional regulator with XRE-family HTH domain
MTPDDWREYVEDLRANVGYNVRRLRLRRGWTQAELAARARTARTIVQRIERGEDTTVGTLLKLVVALGARPGEMFFQPREFGTIPVFDQD